MIRNTLALVVLLAMGACDGDGGIASTNPGTNNGGSGGHMCTAAGCGPSVSLQTQPLQLSFEKIQTLTVVVCKNATCSTGSLASLPAPAPRTGTTLVLAATDRAVLATVWGQTDGGYYLDADWSEWNIDALQDGDVFSAQLVEPAGQVVAATTKSVTYKLIQPNGADCAPTCKIAN